MLCESQSLETHDIDIVLDALIGCRQVYNHVIVGAGACPVLTAQPLVGGVSDAESFRYWPAYTKGHCRNARISHRSTERKRTETETERNALSFSVSLDRPQALTSV